MVSGDSMHFLFCVLSIEIRWHIDYNVNFANKYSDLAGRHPDVRDFFLNIMFVSAKWRNVVTNKVACNYKVFTYNWKT